MKNITKLFAIILLLAPLSSFAFDTNLKQGMKGAEVEKVQKFLVQKGYLSTTTFGFYGPATKNAVIKFQKDNGISQTGQWFPITRTKAKTLVTTTEQVVNTTQTTTPTIDQTMIDKMVNDKLAKDKQEAEDKAKIEAQKAKAIKDAQNLAINQANAVNDEIYSYLVGIKNNACIITTPNLSTNTPLCNEQAQKIDELLNKKMSFLKNANLDYNFEGYKKGDLLELNKFSDYLSIKLIEGKKPKLSIF